MSPSSLMFDDVCQFFFFYTYPGSCLQALGRQQFAALHKGVDHMYELPKDNEDNVVVLAKMKAPTNSKGHNDTSTTIHCPNLYS